MDLHVHHGITGQDTRLHGALNTGIDRRDILLGDDAAGDLVEELVTLAGLVGLHSDADVRLGELARTTGLLLVAYLVSCSTDFLRMVSL